MRTLALLQRSGCKAFPEVEHGRQPAELGCRIKNTRLPPAALAYLLGFAFSWKRGGMSAFAERFAAHLSGCGAELRRKASVKAKAEMLRGRGAWPPPGLVCSRNGGCSPIGSPPLFPGCFCTGCSPTRGGEGKALHPLGLGAGDVEGMGWWEGRLELPAPGTPAVRCAGRERQGDRELFIPSRRWRRAWEQCWPAALWGTRGASPEPAGKNKLFAPSPDGQEKPCWHQGLGWGEEGTVGSLGSRLKGRFTFRVAKACWDQSLGKAHP